MRLRTGTSSLSSAELLDVLARLIHLSTYLQLHLLLYPESLQISILRMLATYAQGHLRRALRITLITRSADHIRCPRAPARLNLTPRQFNFHQVSDQRVEIH